MSEDLEVRYALEFTLNWIPSRNRSANCSDDIPTPSSTTSTSKKPVCGYLTVSPLSKVNSFSLVSFPFSAQRGRTLMLPSANMGALLEIQFLRTWTIRASSPTTLSCFVAVGKQSESEADSKSALSAPTSSLVSRIKFTRRKQRGSGQIVYKACTKEQREKNGGLLCFF